MVNLIPALGYRCRYPAKVSMKIYGTVLLLWSLAILVLSVFDWPWSLTSNELGGLFVLTLAGVCPALVAYTKCGLNDDPSIFRPVNKTVEQNHRTMARRFRYWDIFQYGFYASVFGSFVIGMMVPGSINPFLLLASALGILASIWSIIVYPVALELLEPNGKKGSADLK